MINRITQLATMSTLLTVLGAAGLPADPVAIPSADEAIAAPVDGARLIFSRVNSHSSWYRAIDLRSGEATVISLHGDGDTDLDLFVYDAAGDLVIASEGLTDEESVWVLPFATGRFYIRVRNLGPVYNDCTLHIR